MLARTGTFARQLMIAFGLHFADPQRVDRARLEFSFAFLLGTQFGFACSPFRLREDIQIYRVTLVMQAEEGDQCDIVWSAHAVRRELSRSELYWLDPLLDRSVIGNQHRNIIGRVASGSLHRTEWRGQQYRAVEDRDTSRIVRHRLRAQRHRERQVDLVSVSPRAADLHVTGRRD